MHSNKSSFYYYLNIGVIPRIKAVFVEWGVEVWLSKYSRLIHSDSVGGLRDAKDLHQTFTSDLSLKLSRNILKQEALLTFSLTSAPLLGVPVSLLGVYEEPRADRTSQSGISDSNSCDQSRLQLSDALHVLSTETCPTLPTARDDCSHRRTETTERWAVSLR